MPPSSVDPAPETHPRLAGSRSIPDEAWRGLRVLIAAENISLRLSGETLLPYHYLHGFRALGIDVSAICHARVRDQLRADLDPALFARVSFVEDGFLQRIVHAVGRHFPYRIEDLVFNQVVHMLTQIRMRRTVRSMVRAQRIDVVFEPAPIAPKALSFLFGLGAPVVIGPMSGGMDLPPAFRGMDGAVVRIAIRAARRIASLLHRIVPGKPSAAALLVANEQTLRALPPGLSGDVHMVFESAVELERWAPRTYADAPAAEPVRFIFCSRFVDWKGIGYLVDAFVPLARMGNAHLELVGDGELFDIIRQRIETAGIADAVTLHGRLSGPAYIERLRQADVFVTPSLRECGGIAMLEAMAIGLPVIGVNWGGAAQYTRPDCAILVDPTSEASLVADLTSAMRRLAASYPLRRAMGEAGRRRIIDGGLDWQSRTKEVAAILADVAARHRRMAAIQSLRKTAPAEPVRKDMEQKSGLDIAFYTRSLHNGGVDRVVFNLAEEFLERGLRVAILVDMDNIYSPFRALLPPGVRYEVLNARGPLARLIKLRRFLRTERPRAVMCTSFGFPNIYAVVVRWIAGVPYRLMLTEHCFPSVDSAAPKFWQARYWFFRIAHFIYPHADEIVAVSKGTADDLARVIAIDPARVKCIYNPIVNDGMRNQAKAAVDHPWFGDTGIPVIIAVGRLEAQKDFTLLIRAFAAVRAETPCRLLILGDGSEREMLSGLIREAKLEDCVQMPGFAANPHAYIAKAALLVLSSRFESLANVVIEAMAVGTPVVATDCPSGPAEALAGGRYGTLVPVGNVERLAEAMLAVLRRRPQPVPSAWLDQFSTKWSADRYLELLDATAP